MLERNEMAALDAQNMLGSIEVLDKQVTDAWKTATQIEFPEEYKNATNIVWFGMGGSHLGMQVVKSLFKPELTLPVEIVNDYHVPGIVNQDTLVILSSYSGTTEEVVAAAEEAMKRTKKVFVITTGGDLEQLAREHNLPAYIFEPTQNPSNQPRMAVGYAIAGTFAALSNLGFISVTQDDINGVAAHLQELHSTFGADVAIENNPVKELAQTLVNQNIIYVSSEFLEGSTNVMANQTNENGKHMASRFPIPEMNHHLCEGLVFPADALTQMTFVFIESNLYHPRNQARHSITQQVVEKNNVPYARVQMTGDTKMKQAFELLLFGSYLSFYLAMLHDIDPSPIPNVDYFKAELKKV